ncbi:ATP phosphoribosyltransferase regulatory subunit [Methylomagnum sp.]
MLTQDRWLLPEGVDEVYPEEAARLESLRRKVLDLFSAWGYRLVIPPMIEFIDSLLVGTGRDLDIQTFKLIDQISGRLMGIRADMTPQIARIDARSDTGGSPARLCYLGTVLHSQLDHLERSRSPMQVGAELYGYAGSASDVEIIRLMLETLAMAGITDVHLDLGHVGIYRGLACLAGLNPEQEAELFEIMQRKDRTEVCDFLNNAKITPPVSDMFVALLNFNGPEQVLREARRLLGNAGDFAIQAIANLESIADDLKRLFPALPVNFDLAELRGYHYQRGVVFAAFVPGYGREIARGGRYDEIGEAFGRARPATGFSADLKVLARLSSTVYQSFQNTSIFAPAVDDADLYDTIRRLRADGNIVIQELPGQSEGGREMGCGFELQSQDGTWKPVKL